MFSRKSLITVLGIVLACGATAIAQQTPAQSLGGSDRPMRERSERFGQRGERRGGPGRMGHRGGLRQFTQELNLTDAQREQMRAIMQRRMSASKSQREELFALREKRIAGTFTADDEARAKALRQEMRASMEGIHAEMEGLLTAEQKAKLEQLKAERKAKMGERLQERRQRRNQNQL